MNWWFIVGICVYQILCYADFKIGHLMVSSSFDSKRKLKFWHIAIGWALTVVFWPIPLVIALYLDYSTHQHHLQEPK